MKIEELVEHYQKWFNFSYYYDLLLNQKMSEDNEFIKNSEYLDGINRCEGSHNAKEEIIDAKMGDIRIDVPVWIGNLEKATKRIVVLGSEPRDTDSAFNVERINFDNKNFIFGNPFGVNRWNLQSSVKRKPQNKYFSVFEQILKQDKVFILFSDAVKTYEMKFATSKENDRYARSLFKIEFEKQKELLLKELELISPTHILVLGNDAFSLISQTIIGRRYPLYKIRHPAQGGVTQAKKEISELFADVN